MLINGTEFGQRLRRILENKHMTRNQAAASLQIPGPQLSRYLHGQIPDTRTLLKLARWGSCSMEWLLLGDPEDAEKSRPVDHRDDDALRMVIYHLPSIQEEAERVQKLWDNLEHNYRPVALQLLELLQPTAETKVDLLSYLNMVISLIQDEHASRSASLTRRVAFFRSLLQICRERLSHESLQHLWDETGRYLHAQQGAGTSVSYPKFIEQLVTSLDNEHRQTIKDVKSDIRERLEGLRTGRTFPSVIIAGIVESAARIPESPAALSRIKWRKSQAFRKVLERYATQAKPRDMTPKAWEAFCKEASKMVLGS